MLFYLLTKNKGNRLVIFVHVNIERIFTSTGSVPNAVVVQEDSRFKNINDNRSSLKEKSFIVCSVYGGALTLCQGTSPHLTPKLPSLSPYPS